MPRLESSAKAGHYPAPPEVVERVAALIRPANLGPHQSIRLLDPCCGTGAALAQLVDSVGGETYGIEIAQDRYEEARTALDHVLHTSAFTVRVGHGAFSCLWLNPPYDYGDDGQRLEHAFLTATARALCPGGLLLFLVPQRRLWASARYLAGHFTRMACYRFPDPLFAAFGQVVLLAVKRDRPVSPDSSRTAIEQWSSGELSELPATGAAEAIYDLPLLPDRTIIFSSQFLDAEAAAEEARRQGLWVSSLLAERLWPVDERPVHPLMPLRRGHLAVLMAAGFLNNILLEAESRRMLVKGRTYKELVRVDSDDPKVEVEREVLRTSVTALDLATGEFEVVQQSGASSRLEDRAA